MHSNERLNKKLLALVSRDMNQSQIEETVTSICNRLKTDLGITEVGVTDSVFWYNTLFPVAGNWESWIWESVNGKDFGTRKPHFVGFVVCSAMLGRANAAIVKLALRDKRTVLHWSSARHPLSIVVEVIGSDDNNWKTGWSVRTRELMP